MAQLPEGLGKIVCATVQLVVHDTGLGLKNIGIILFYIAFWSLLNELGLRHLAKKQ
jgi:hypothetical protein